jgi:hypothetical protein
VNSNYRERLSLSNTIVAGNTDTIALYRGADIFSMGLVSADHSLLGDVNANGISGITNIIIDHANPLLGPLQNNGGPTQTMALLPGSLAIGHGNNAKAPATDQRGVARMDVAGETTDIGAFEL